MKTLILVGDTNLRKMDAGAQPFALVQDMLDQADIRFCNNENCFSNPEVGLPYKAGWYHTENAHVDLLSQAGFDAVGHANNVSFGETAILDSIAALDSKGIAHTGVGPDYDTARQPAIVTSDDIRFGFLSYTSVYQPVAHAASETQGGVATIKGHTAYRPHRRVLEMPGVPPEIETWADEDELGAMAKDVEALRPKADLVTLSNHWGVSSSIETLDYQREIARTAIRSGADVIIGHHPHVIQGVEVIEGRPVFYSLGNFVFGWEKMQSRHRAGIAVECDVSSEGLQEARIRPVWRDDTGRAFPAAVDSEEGTSILNDVRERSERFGTEFRETETGLSILLT